VVILSKYFIISLDAIILDLDLNKKIVYFTYYDIFKDKLIKLRK